MPSMLPAASNASSGWPGGLPSEGWNERALQSSIVNQTLSLLTAPGLSSTPSSTIPAINPSNTTSTTSTTITSTAKRTSLFDDDEEGLQGLMDDQGEDDQPKTKGPNNYTDAEMEPFAAMDLESLRAAANHYAVRRRMSHDMKDELDELYYNFQCSVVRSAIRNHIKPHLFAHYLGHSHRINGGMSWNNFQRYDLEALEGFFVLASFHPDSPIFKKGGSPFGNRYLEMLGGTKGVDAPAQFHTWVAAQSIQVNNGCQPTEIKRQRIKSVGDVTDKFLVGTSSGNKLSCAWPGKNCAHQLKGMKLSLDIAKNDWSLIPSYIMIPLEKLKNGLDRTVLAWLSLNKIHLTYHPDWDAPPPKSKAPDKRKHSSKRTPKHNTSTRPTRPAPRTSNSNASNHPADALNTYNSSAADRPAAAPNTSHSSAADGAAGAPNTSNPTTSDRAAAAPHTSSSSGPKKRKRPAPNTSNSGASDHAAAAPNAANRKTWNRASAARKARDSHFSKRSAAANNTRNLDSSDGTAAEGPDSNNNSTNVSHPHSAEGTTSSRREPVPVLDPLLDALDGGIAYS
ncbi:hypothetical protein PSHT_08251 [Puccinia striiformis]|uniref:Uncharacterized protein n=1 Tax=Puccinia striiformis TaxID=27350 RepID=A0A2S4VR08_9BASI|nr:hypothetical protein PSHT_08251 [Puccinia striiformis]